MTHSSETIRSFALIGHGGCGKTSMAEALAFLTDKNTRLGSVTDHTSLMDFEPEEQKRGGSISTSFLTTEHDGYRFHVADTPGDSNFLHEAYIAMQGVDAAVIVVSAVDGVEVSTEQAAAEAIRQGLPRAVFLNKMDREHTKVDAIVAELGDVVGGQPVLVQIPMGDGPSFKGVVDLLCKKAYSYEGDKGIPTPCDVPAELSDAYEEAMEVLTEAVAAVDDELIEKYFEEGELSDEDLQAGLAKAILAGELVPVVLGSAQENIGLDRLLSLMRAFPGAQDRPALTATVPGTEDEIERGADPEGPIAALCIKTIIDRVGSLSVFRLVSGTLSGDSSVVNARTGDQERLGTLYHVIGSKRDTVDQCVPGDLFGVAKLRDTHTGDTLTDPKKLALLPYQAPPPGMMSYTVKPSSRADVSKLKAGLSRLLAEDPGLRQAHDEVTKELVLTGMGTNHVAISVEKMQRKYGVNVELGTPSIPYRETISATADVRYRHKKQTGGAGQFGEVAIKVKPAERGEGFVFLDNIVGGVIPNSLIPSVEKGIRDQMSKGIIAGYQAVDIEVSLYDGKYHPVDSKDIAFQIAGRQAIKEAFSKAKPILLEPVYKVAVVVPEDFVGDIMGDMNTRRGRISNMESRGRKSVVNATVPLAEMQSYAPDLRSMTGGQGFFTMEFESYQRVPHDQQDKVIAAAKAAEDDD